MVAGLPMCTMKNDDNFDLDWQQKDMVFYEKYIRQDEPVTWEGRHSRGIQLESITQAEIIQNNNKKSFLFVSPWKLVLSNETNHILVRLRLPHLFLVNFSHFLFWWRSPGIFALILVLWSMLAKWMSMKCEICVCVSIKKKMWLVQIFSYFSFFMLRKSCAFKSDINHNPPQK